MKVKWNQLNSCVSAYAAAVPNGGVHFTFNSSFTPVAFFFFVCCCSFFIWLVIQWWMKLQLLPCNQRQLKGNQMDWNPFRKLVIKIRSYALYFMNIEMYAMSVAILNVLINFRTNICCCSGHHGAFFFLPPSFRCPCAFIRCDILFSVVLVFFFVCLTLSGLNFAATYSGSTKACDNAFDLVTFDNVYINITTAKNWQFKWHTLHQTCMYVYRYRMRQTVIVVIVVGVLLVSMPFSVVYTYKRFGRMMCHNAFDYRAHRLQELEKKDEEKRKRENKKNAELE